MAFLWKNAALMQLFISERLKMENRTCDHCKKKAQTLHLSEFTDQISPREGFVLIGTRKRFSYLCHDCWFEMLETLEKFLKEIKATK
jgi:thymidine kinase